MIRTTRITVIPAYNEAAAIADVVKESLKHSDKVIVVDNNSSDNTFNIAESSGADVIDCDIQGAGAATRSGIAYALKYNPDMIVTLDSDGQHDPSEIDKVCEPIGKGIADVVVGGRFIDRGNMPRYRKFGNDVVSLDYSYYFLDQQIKDTQSGFRAFNRKVAESVKLTDDGFGFATEFLVKARKLGYKIIEVPIRCIYFDEISQNSTFNPIKMAAHVLWATEKWRFKEDFWAIMRKF